MQSRQHPPATVASCASTPDNFFLELIASSVTDGGPLSTCMSYTHFHVCQFPILCAASVTSPLWLPSTRPLLIWTGSSRLKSYSYLIRCSTSPPNSPFGQFIPSGLVLWELVYGSSPTSADIKHFQSPNPSIMPLAGCCIPGGYTQSHVTFMALICVV